MFMECRAGRLVAFAVVTLAAGMWAGCSLEDPGAPALTAPSEFGLSVTLSATPDRLPRDGTSQAVITVSVRDAQNRPVSGQLLSLGVAPAGARLSAAQVTTGATGQATFTVTAPPASAVASDPVVTVVATPMGSGGGAVPRAVTVLLTGSANTTAPTPSFSVAPPSPEVMQIATFDASATTDEGVPCNDACTYAWDFGGEAAASGRVVTYQFRAVRIYPVTLTVTDALGSVAALTKSVTVGQGTPPTAAFTFSPISPRPSQTVNFTAVASQAGPGRTIAGYQWNFGDGSSATGVTAAHAYDSVGVFSVTLTVTDSAGLQHSLSKDVTVAQGTPPTAAFTFSPTAPRPSQTVNFTAVASQAGPGKTIASYAWNFGDGSSETGVTASHAYEAVGTYSVTLTVTDSAGLQGSVSQSLTVGQGTPPTAVFTFSPTSPLPLQTVNFTAAASQAGPGKTIASYAWNFGDGSTATGVTAARAYAAVGTYSVTLTVTDNAGLQGSASQSLTVGLGTPPTAVFTFSPTSPLPLQTVNFTAAGSQAGAGKTITSYAWNFGDGSTATGVTAARAYAAVGTYSVTLTVTDSAGLQSSLSKDVPVAIPAPSAPTGLTATPVSSSRIDLSWTDTSATETGFEIYRCLGAGCTNFTSIASVAADVVSYSNTGLASGTLYRYQVRAVNTGGASTFSPPAEATTP